MSLLVHHEGCPACTARWRWSRIRPYYPYSGVWEVRVPRYEGRLELTWTNKDQRLLAQEDGTYEWAAPSDYRVAEVRLLHDAGTVGEVHGEADRAKDNLLIRGDALNALTSLIELSEFAREYVGKVKLAYLDPPFNTQQSFLHYDDALEHSVWLTMMRDRLLSIKTLLSPDGSVWVHCDDSEHAYLKVMMDEVFGREYFVATVVWQKRTSRENRAAIGASHDYIVVYAPAGPADWAHIRNRLPATETGYANPDNDPRGRGGRFLLRLRAGARTRCTRSRRRQESGSSRPRADAGVPRSLFSRG